MIPSSSISPSFLACRAQLPILLGIFTIFHLLLSYSYYLMSSISTRYSSFDHYGPILRSIVRLTPTSSASCYPFLCFDTLSSTFLTQTSKSTPDISLLFLPPSDSWRLPEVLPLAGNSIERDELFLKSKAWFLSLSALTSIL